MLQATYDATAHMPLQLTHRSCLLADDQYSCHHHVAHKETSTQWLSKSQRNGTLITLQVSHQALALMLLHMQVNFQFTTSITP